MGYFVILGYIVLAALSISSWIAVDSGRLPLFGASVLVLATVLGATYGPQSALYAEMLFSKSQTSMAVAAYAIVIFGISLIGVLMVPKRIQDRDPHV